MPNPTADFASQTPQFPLNAGGIFGQNGILTYGRFYTGSGGLPALGQITGPTGISTGIKNNAAAGWPGIGATLVGTGRYNIMHPPATVVALKADAVTPSGLGLVVNTVRNVGTGIINATVPGQVAATGITQIQVFGAAGGGASGALQHVNPPTGVRFDLFLYTAPNNTQGLTQF